MTSGHYDSIHSFREVYTVSQTTLVKLIVITNCKDLNHFFFFFFLLLLLFFLFIYCIYLFIYFILFIYFFFFLASGNFANLCCQGYLDFSSREKYFIVSYGMLIH